MSTVINGKSISEGLISENIRKIESLKQRGIEPCIALIRVGDNPGSLSYEKSIMSIMAKCHIGVKSFLFEQNISSDEIYALIKSLNEDVRIHGILVFMPLPKHISKEMVNNAIDPKKDIDAISPWNMGKLMLGEKAVFPCSAEAVLTVLKHESIDVKGKNITIINNSNILGKPLSAILSNMYASVRLCHVFTDSIEKYTKDADVVISACGVKDLIKPDMLKKGAVYIDAGIVKTQGENGRSSFSGDASAECCKGDFYICSRTHGLGDGIGTITTAILAKHVVDLLWCENYK